MPQEDGQNLQSLVAEVAAAYFANSHVSVAEISTVIGEIAKSLGAVGESAAPATETIEEPTATPKLTTAQIRRSITPAALISFEDGRPYKTLRRHLAVKGLTPEQYREKWGLPTIRWWQPTTAPRVRRWPKTLALVRGVGGQLPLLPHGPALEPGPRQLLSPDRRGGSRSQPGGAAPYWGVWGLQVTGESKPAPSASAGGAPPCRQRSRAFPPRT